MIFCACCVGDGGVVGGGGSGLSRGSGSMVVVVIVVVVLVVVVTVVVGVLNLVKHTNFWFVALGYHIPVGGGDGCGSGDVVCGCDGDSC